MVDPEAMAGSRRHSHGLGEVRVDQCFFPCLTVLQAWIFLTLCLPSDLKAQAGTASVFRGVGLQGVGQVLLKLLVKLPSPALAWIPELHGAGCMVQKLSAAWETPALSFPHVLPVPTLA